ncbi:glycosyltransferase, partial [Patescibacteria group bacterium]
FGEIRAQAGYLITIEALRFLSLELLKTNKHKMKVFVNTPYWNSPLDNRINEQSSLSKNADYIKLITSGNFGDVYYNVAEEGDKRMEGFEKATGYKHHTIKLAIDKKRIYPEFSKNFKADISFVGTDLPGKRHFMKQQVFPLRDTYDLRLYGQDWTKKDKLLGYAQKLGQYLNIPLLKTIQKPNLQIDDERKIYTSSTISINFHEDYQREFGGDCNERTFKIPASKGFQITDDVACIKKYFKEHKEIIIAKDKKDWFEKIEYYIKNPEKRNPIIEAGKKRVLKEHTYNHRVKKFIKIYESL